MDAAVDILLVEDDPGHVELIRRAFEGVPGSWRLAVAEDLAGARKLLAGDDVRLGLVIADWLLPDGKGLDLIDAARSRGGIPVVVMTSHGSEQVAVEALRAGALDYVVKSVESMADMPHVAERALGAWARRREQERTLELLRESEARFRSLIESAPESIFVQSEGRFVYVNAAMVRLAGVSGADQLLGREWTERIAPEFHETVRERIRLQRETGRAAPLMEMAYLRADGARVPVETTAVAIRYQDRDAHLVFVRDITERRSAQNSLRREQAYNQAVLSSMADAVLVFSGSGEIRSGNRGVTELLGFRPEELVGQPVTRLFADAGGARFPGMDGLLRVLQRGALRDLDTAMVRKDGGLVPVSLSCAALPGPKNALQDCVLVARDVGARKRLQDEQREYAGRLEAEVSERTREIRESEGRYRALFDSVDHAVVLTDTRGRVQSWNAATSGLLGWSRASAEGRAIPEVLCRRPDCPSHAGLLARVLELGSWSHECAGVREDGVELPLHLSISTVRDAAGEPQGLIWVMTDLSERERLAEELRRTQGYAGVLLRMAGAQGPLLGRGEAYWQGVRFVKDSAAAPSSVLLLGESGTGKEVMARTIHANSPRADKPFVVLDCSAMSEALLESELFGHEKGAFTGAGDVKLGLVEVADGGTLFVDEIGEMPVELQPKLLRVLERGEFRRLGSVAERRVDIRVIAATNRDLEREVKRGAFRTDLYFRLKVLVHRMAPLRERREDIPLLAQHFLDTCRVTVAVKKEFREETLSHLAAYDWPGNIRELSNVVEHAVILSGEGRTILPKHLPLAVRGKGAARGMAAARRTVSLADSERAAIEQALGSAGGNKTRAAELLGITRLTLRRKIQRYGLEPDRPPRK